MNTSMSNPDHANDAAGDEQRSWASVAGAVLRAARLSAGLTGGQLAAAAGVDEHTILYWEKGTEPLASVVVTQVETLKDALRTARAGEQLIADLDASIWCDVVLGAMAAHPDISLLLADPLARDPAFGELLGWAVSGNVPARYARFASDLGTSTSAR